ncbi:MAG: hypothetical protein KIS67_25235 [Verrucomicrobiae bacterium]|nr:hypothetical protein [Verrucomicrobiae bacterium]
MKRMIISSVMAAGLLIGGLTLPAFGGNGNGCGYGGPPKSDEERAARQAACLEKNGGICPNGGPRAEYPGFGQGKGRGQGKGWGKGVCDGTGPKGPNGKGPGPRAGQGR